MTQIISCQTTCLAEESVFIFICLDEKKKFKKLQIVFKNLMYMGQSCFLFPLLEILSCLKSCSKTCQANNQTTTHILFHVMPICVHGLFFSTISFFPLLNSELERYKQAFASAYLMDIKSLKLMESLLNAWLLKYDCA